MQQKETEESWKKKRKAGKKMKNAKKKKKEKCTVDYCCNPQWFWVWGTVISPYYLDVYIIFTSSIFKK